MEQFAPNLPTRTGRVETHAGLTKQYFNSCLMFQDYIGNVGRMSTRGYSLANPVSCDNFDPKGKGYQASPGDRSRHHKRLLADRCSQCFNPLIFGGSLLKLSHRFNADG